MTKFLSVWAWWFIVILSYCLIVVLFFLNFYQHFDFHFYLSALFTCIPFMFFRWSKKLSLIKTFRSRLLYGYSNFLPKLIHANTLGMHSGVLSTKVTLLKSEFPQKKMSLHHFAECSNLFESNNNKYYRMKTV